MIGDGDRVRPWPDSKKPWYRSPQRKGATPAAPPQGPLEFGASRLGHIFYERLPVERVILAPAKRPWAAGPELVGLMAGRNDCTMHRYKLRIMGKLSRHS